MAVTTVAQLVDLKAAVWAEKMAALSAAWMAATWAPQ